MTERFCWCRYWGRFLESAHNYNIASRIILKILRNSQAFRRIVCFSDYQVSFWNIFMFDRTFRSGNYLSTSKEKLFIVFVFCSYIVIVWSVFILTIIVNMKMLFSEFMSIHKHFHIVFYGLFIVNFTFAFGFVHYSNSLMEKIIANYVFE